MQRVRNSREVKRVEVFIRKDSLAGVRKWGRWK